MWPPVPFTRSCPIRGNSNIAVSRHVFYVGPTNTKANNANAVLAAAGGSTCMKLSNVFYSCDSIIFVYFHRKGNMAVCHRVNMKRCKLSTRSNKCRHWALRTPCHPNTLSSERLATRTRARREDNSRRR